MIRNENKKLQQACNTLYLIGMDYGKCKTDEELKEQTDKLLSALQKYTVPDKESNPSRLFDLAIDIALNAAARIGKIML